jgi:TetR/AcrR family transcriptional regulator, mexJK operon transcriptional repressor
MESSRTSPPGSVADPPVRPRRTGRLASAGAIREAAATLFLANGYQGTSMDEIAAAAQVSKQTIYTHFASKEELFADLVLGNVERVDDFVNGMPAVLEEASDLESGLRRLARLYIRLVIRPEVLRLRRLVVGESGRFPELARAYYDRVPARMYSALATLLKQLADDGKLRMGDPTLAAHHFAWLTLGKALDQAMFSEAELPVRAEDLDHIADAAVRVFLAAYSMP